MNILPFHMPKCANCHKRFRPRLLSNLPKAYCSIGCLKSAEPEHFAASMHGGNSA